MSKITVNREVDAAYKEFLADAAKLRSVYGDNSIDTYLTTYRARISAQISTQLELITQKGFHTSRMLSLGGWPGAAPIILKRLTGIEAVILDHPALLTPAMKSFYTDQGLETAAFDFCNAAAHPLPLSGKYQLIECCQCIEHWNFSPVPVFRQIFSTLLADNGSLFITAPNAASLFRRLSLLTGSSPYPRMQSFIDVDNNQPGAEVSPHWREYTCKDIEQLVSHCKGHCARIYTRSYPRAGRRSLQHRLYSLFNNLHPALRENIEAICEKMHRSTVASTQQEMPHRAERVVF